MSPNPVATPAELLARADTLARSLAEQSATRDRERQLPFEVFEQVRALRLGTVHIPRAFGGAGGDWRDVAQLFITLARGDSNVAQAFLSHFVFIERLRLMGSPAQHQQFLPQAAAGVLFGGAAAERGGAFRGEVATGLVRQGGQYRLNGTKHYCTGALFADVLKVRAVDEHGQMVAALVPATRAGVTRLDDWDGLGQRCTASGTTLFDDVVVFSEEVLPMARWQTERHHSGASAQIIHCAIDAGIALAALDDALAWARRGIRPVKESGVQRAQDDPFVLHTLGTMATQARAAEALTLHAGSQLAQAAEARFSGAAAATELALEASLAVAAAKAVSTQACLAVAQALFDVGGASTTLARHNHDRHWRNARTHTTHDPVAYKYRALGDYWVNGTEPPLTFSY
ncbi:acyl-CoA dehydrogenase family protein [Pseudomonas typographi]|uniref:Dibenzothiophene monooxygenase n=1 Tax=Pseudomonas typographi TaxID=2715964 RepID=A0ABR7YWX8_9PSED|nr:acyl-CoA dehydrogenase family protein [Pseudomonas typographi]MBD1551270.1 dehydrogenase [Pseudomonas typographi]MBD1597708.1 dehydrogenase [Pseudomonas typographi]